MKLDALNGEMHILMEECSSCATSWLWKDCPSCGILSPRGNITMNQPSDTIEGLFWDNDNATYDAVAKQFLSHRIFLA